MSSLNKSSLAALALVGSLGLGASGCAHAGNDVFWSVAVGQPGVSVGVSNGPVMMPVHYPAPVVVAPRPVYVPPRVVYAPAYPVYQSYPAYRGWEHHHHGYYAGGYREHERFEHRRERFEERRDFDHRPGPQRDVRPPQHGGGGGRIGGPALNMGR